MWKMEEDEDEKEYKKVSNTFSLVFLYTHTFPSGPIYSPKGLGTLAAALIQTLSSTSTCVLSQFS
jgi:hypothetical protein